MKSKRRSGLSLAVLAGAAWLLLGCAHKEVEPPKSAAVAPHAESTGTTTTTGGPVSASSPHTTSMNVSDELARACDLHFSAIAEAPKFDFDKSDLRPDDDEVLEQIAKCVTTGPLRGRSIRLVGRADPRGEVEYNFALGEHRASSVEQYLKGLGVDSSRVKATSRGKLDASGTDEATWQRDRRVDVELM
jgi:peptidoglycan-associated lipoprotein